MKRIVTVMFGAAVIVVIGGIARGQDAGSDKAMEVFVAQKCTTCHSIAGRGNKKGALDEVGSQLSSAEIKAWLTDPEGMAARRKPASTRKPPMKKKAMSDADLETLVAFLAAQKKG